MDILNYRILKTNKLDINIAALISKFEIKSVPTMPFKADFIMSKYSVLQDPHLDAQAKYKIISYLEQKVVGECTKPLS